MSATASPILEKRRAQAEVIRTILAELEPAIGREAACAVIDRAIRKAAIAEGAAFREDRPRSGDPVADFAELFELWTRGGVLEIDNVERSDREFNFDVTRCRYAEMYREMGLGDIGHLLSCNRDGAFIEGFDPEMKLDRAQTIMAGAPCCTFRYRRDG